MNRYAKIALIVLLVIGLAQFAPQAVNMFLVLVLISMLILQADEFAALLASLKL